ncbi:unnamed protein product [Prorocentrum cordatum]|uniref:Uncharacterized protein n=1 Tax=Prorocentrum cordatum TaxID=2364126 RepID=A0ABN9VWN6_9DINO|nr:unnamed protein product [Polarella glacialis]
MIAKGDSEDEEKAHEEEPNNDKDENDESYLTPIDEQGAVISTDDCCMNTELETVMVTNLVMVQKPEDLVASITVVHRGSSEYVNSAVEFYVYVWGSEDIMLKGDQEASLQAVIMAVKNRREYSTQVEKSPKGSHQSNGTIENAVERVEPLLRTLHTELEFNLKVKIGPKSLIMPWLVRHVEFLLTRFAIKTDGRTAWERLGRAKYKSELGKIGETIDYKIQAKDYPKLEPRWSEGLFLGRRDENDEIIVGTVRGIEHARTMKLRSAEDTYSKEMYNTLIGVPWNSRGLEVKDQNEVVRRWRYITKSLIEEHGPTDGCVACEGTSAIHNARCRTRFAKIFDEAEPRIGMAIPANPDQAAGYKNRR